MPSHDNAVETTASASSVSIMRRSLERVPRFRRPTCVWSFSTQTCLSKRMRNSNDDSSNATATTPYEYECPLAPVPYPDDPPPLLPDWMGHLVTATRHSNTNLSFTLADLSLPGTHDSFTYDLSLTVSDDGLDHVEALANLLHYLSGGTLHLLPGDLEEFFRLQAKTQQLTISQQLDNGIRFIDCRIMLERSYAPSSDNSNWYSIHFMQSKQVIAVYWQEIRRWLDQHPQEVVVIWLSKHGNPDMTGTDQYPGVSPVEKKEIWNIYTHIFDGLLLDATQSSFHKTPLSTLIQRNHRVVTLATDYVEFTQSSSFAMDAHLVLQNTYETNGGIFSGIQQYLQNHKDYFRHAEANNRELIKRGGMSLLAMNTQGASWLIESEAQERFLPLIPTIPPHKCAHRTQLDSITKWCPRTLLDVVQLGSYYNQLSLEWAYTQNQTFPMLFYLDGLDYNGTIRTGSQLLNGYMPPHEQQQQHATDAYAYVDTVLAYNVRKVCKTCKDFITLVERRRRYHPVSMWLEQEHGRVIV